MKTKATILVADDERDIRRALQARLTGFGYRVIEAMNGLTVLTQYLSEPVDAMVLDHDMPAAKGREIARVVRKESQVPIIFLSGYDREQFREIVTQLPDVYFLPKPLDANRLKDLLASLVGVCACGDGVGESGTGRWMSGTASTFRP